MSFPSSFRLRDDKLLAKRADKSGWATDVQKKVPCLQNYTGSWWVIKILLIKTVDTH